MKPARFSYEKPRTLDEALASLAARRDGAKIIAGGQSLAPMLNMRLAQPGHLIDINGLAGLDEIRMEDQRLVVGALVRHANLARNDHARRVCPLLAHAAATIGHYAIRERGTIGGSLAHADPAAQLPLVAIALDAEMELVSTRRRRTVAARDFFLSIFTTAIEPDELLVAAQFPKAHPHEAWGFRLLARRAGDFAIVATAVVVSLNPDRRVARLSLAAGGIGPVPVRLDAAGQGAIGVSIDERNWMPALADAAAAAPDIEDAESIPAVYRRDLVRALVHDALADAIERLR
jgi:aerobic carbon-monoxide dehydrogenase medium subunit